MDTSNSEKAFTGSLPKEEVVKIIERLNIPQSEVKSEGARLFEENKDKRFNDVVDGLKDQREFIILLQEINTRIGSEPIEAKAKSLKVMYDAISSMWRIRQEVGQKMQESEAKRTGTYVATPKTRPSN